MANPQIVNKTPADGQTSINIVDGVSFSLRDVDSRVDLATLWSSMIYAQVNYEPDDLPLVDDDFTASAVVRFGGFDDTPGAIEPTSSANQTIVTIGPDKVYRIERTVSSPSTERGFLLASADSRVGIPVGVQVTLDIPTWTSAPTSFGYVTYTDFTGVMLGLIHWMRNTGVFLFFRDNAGTRRITVAGPSTDSFGTRTVEQTTILDWSADTYTYTILFDDTPGREKILVIAKDSTGAETRLADITVSSLPEFLANVSIAGYESNLPPDMITMVLGTDGPTLGDQLDVYAADLAAFGNTTIQAGVESGAASLYLMSNDVIALDPTAGVADFWAESSTDGTITVSTDSVSIEKDTAGSHYYLGREEPDTTRQEWLLVGKISGFDITHIGTYNTSVGVDVHDGTNAYELRFLDDFIDNYVGLFSGTDKGVLADYTFPSTNVDWETAFTFTMWGSTSRGTVRVYFSQDDDPDIDTGAYSAPTVSTDTSVRVGFLDSGAQYGAMQVEYLWTMMNVTLYEPVDTSYPEAQGWIRTNAGGSRTNTSDRLQLNQTTAGSYDIYYITDPDYDETSGVSCFLKLNISAWTDSAGAASPSRLEYGPVLALRSDTTFAQLHFVSAEDGTTYAFFSSSASDYLDVLSQNTAGAAISCEVDTSSDTVFLVELKPRQYLRLYINYAIDPSIEVGWDDIDTVLRAAPTNLNAAAVVGFGSLGEDSGVNVEFAWVRASLGTGYDLVTAHEASDADMGNIYGSKADVVIDFEDMD